jgi:hypothetical protein
MRRRDFITLIGGAAAVWPVGLRAQQAERMRRIGILLPANADDAEFQAWVGSFVQGLQQSGWTIGRNVQIDTRWATANAAAIRRHAAELVALAPDVILAHGTMSVGPSLEATHTVPIVFPVAADPEAVDALARKDQAAKIKDLGGREKILVMGSFTCSRDQGGLQLGTTVGARLGDHTLRILSPNLKVFLEFLAAKVTSQNVCFGRKAVHTVHGLTLARGRSCVQSTPAAPFALSADSDRISSWSIPPRATFI